MINVGVLETVRDVLTGMGLAVLLPPAGGKTAIVCLTAYGRSKMLGKEGRMSVILKDTYEIEEHYLKGDYLKMLEEGGGKIYRMDELAKAAMDAPDQTTVNAKG